MPKYPTKYVSIQLSDQHSIFNHSTKTIVHSYIFLIACVVSVNDISTSPTGITQLLQLRNKSLSIVVVKICALYGCNNGLYVHAITEIVVSLYDHKQRIRSCFTLLLFINLNIHIYIYFTREMFPCYWECTIYKLVYTQTHAHMYIYTYIYISIYIYEIYIRRVTTFEYE